MINKIALQTVVLMIFCVLMLNWGCRADSDVSSTARSTTTPTLESISTLIPIVPTSAQLTPAISIPTEALVQNLIEKAMNDLAQRLAISISEIAVLEATSVVWPDSSLGCAQEGVMYLPALTPGYLIRLAALDREYEYHTNQDNVVVYCASPSLPLPGMPVDR